MKCFFMFVCVFVSCHVRASENIVPDKPVLTQQLRAARRGIPVTSNIAAIAPARLPAARPPLMTPVLEVSLSTNRSTVYCVTMQLAWNQFPAPLFLTNHSWLPSGGKMPICRIVPCGLRHPMFSNRFLSIK